MGSLCVRLDFRIVARPETCVENIVQTLPIVPKIMVLQNALAVNPESEDAMRCHAGPPAMKCLVHGELVALAVRQLDEIG